MSKKMKNQKTVEELLEEALVPEEEQPYEVPGNWVWVKLGTIVDINPPKIKLNIPNEQICSFIPMASVSEKTGSIEVYEERTFDKVKKGYTQFLEDDILFAKITPCMENGKVAIAKELLNKFGYGSTEFYVLRTNEYIDTKFIYHLVRSDYFRNQAKGNMTGAVGQQRVPKKYLESYPISLPPLNEQKRIADKVERLLNKIDEAKQLIEEAKETFELRRAAILEKAFRGELTKKWRLERKGLLQRNDLLVEIKKEKELTYELECEEANLKGAKKPGRPKAFNVDFDKLSKLPNSWTYCSLGEVIYSFKYGTSSKSEYYFEGKPVIRIPNIGDMEIDLKDLKFLQDSVIDQTQIARKDDILIVRSNGSRDLVGKTAIIDEKSDGLAFASYLIRIRPVKVNPKFILLLLNTESIKKQFFSKSKSSAGINNINTEELASTIIPLPPIEEQIEIVNIVNKLLQYEKSNINVLDITSITNSLKCSTLNKAFRGELDTNDPSDESAIELLKRVLQQ